MMNDYYINKITGLYAITQDTSDSNLLFKNTLDILNGGARVIQYRNKSNDNELRLFQSKLLKEACDKFNATFIINDDIYLAKNINADGAHLGDHDVTIKQGRALLGPNAIIGASCYNSIEMAYKAKLSGANYIAFGAVFPSNTKPHAPLVPLSTFKEAKILKLPIVAIGGITAENAEKVIQSGADALAIISGLYERKNPKAEAKKIASFFLRNKPPD